MAKETTKTFADFDKFGLEPFANKLTTYLQVESQFVDESFVLSLNSEFGSGKSTFFEMWANTLNSDGNVFKVVPVNAWESDFQGDPLLAIVSCLLDILQPARDSKEVATIKETAGKLGKFALSIGNDVVQKFTGADIIKAGEYAESGNGIAKSKSGYVCFQLYQEKCELFKELKALLRNFIQEAKLPILVTIDELDRCKPNYAIEFLETIKHIFDIKGLIFVLGVDKNQLASSAKALFGQQLVFDEYYRKFAHRNVSLPVKSQTMTEQFCRKLVAEYLTEKAFEKKNRFSYAEHNSYSEDNIVELCTAFSLNARQIHELFRTAAHVFSASQKLNSTLLSGFQMGTFFMIALSIQNHTLYDQIGKREITLSEFTAFLKGLPLFNNEKYNNYGWANLLYLGVFINQADKMEKEFQTLGVLSQTDREHFQDDLQKFSNSYFGRRSRYEPPFFTIYNTLEELRTFAE
jgi:hypothetical protein